MATVHLICGLPCAGKSTYSKTLRASTGGVHFALDYWLITAFGHYDIEEAGYEDDEEYQEEDQDEEEYEEEDEEYEEE